MLKPNLPYAQIGTIGQVKHGKTTLTSVITKVLALKDKARWWEKVEAIEHQWSEGEGGGIFSRLFPISFIWYETEKRHYTHVEMSLHRDIIFNMISSAAQLDGAILVVSVIEGVMPETREQVAVARQIGVRAMVVFLNKVDLVNDPELAAQEVTELLEAHGYQNAPMVSGSALLAYQSASTDLDAPEYQPILRLLEAVDEWIPTPVPAWEKPLRLPIDEVSPAKESTVVTGRIWQGQLRLGEAVELLGLGHALRRVTAASIESFGRALDSARNGDLVKVLLSGTPHDKVERGMVLAEPGTLTTHAKLVALVYNIAQSEGGQHKTFHTGDSPLLGFGVVELHGTIRLPDGLERLLPGEHVELQIDLVKPLALEIGSGLYIRENGHPTCVGVITQFLD